METITHEHKIFENITYANQVVKNREFEACTFLKCDLSNSNFSHSNFTDCKFVACNLSMIKFNGSSLRNVVFEQCKILGVNFTDCNDFLFSVEFLDSILDYSSFSNKKMAKTVFKDCSLKEVVFTNTNLTKAIFNNTNLDRAIFHNSILKEASFLTAYNYNIDPELNKVEKAKFSISGCVGLLSKYKIIIE